MAEIEVIGIDKQLVANKAEIIYPALDPFSHTRLQATAKRRFIEIVHALIAEKANGKAEPSMVGWPWLPSQLLDKAK